MIWPFIFIAFGLLWLFGTLFLILGEPKSGLGAKVRIALLSLAAVSLVIAAGQIAILDPWARVSVDPTRYGRHGWVAAVINAIYAIGPQWVALLLGAFAAFILRGAWDMICLLRRGYFDRSQ